VAALVRRGRCVPSPWRAANQRHASFALPARERVIADLGIDAQPDQRWLTARQCDATRAAARRAQALATADALPSTRSGRSRAGAAIRGHAPAGVAAAAGEIGFGQDPHGRARSWRDGARAKLGEPRAAGRSRLLRDRRALRADGQGVLGERAGELIFRANAAASDARWRQRRQGRGGYAIGGDDNPSRSAEGHRDGTSRPVATHAPDPS
jgi:hypothetical protein